MKRRKKMKMGLPHRMLMEQLQAKKSERVKIMVRSCLVLLLIKQDKKSSLMGSNHRKGKDSTESRANL